MNPQQARELGQRIVSLVRDRRLDEAHQVLAPVLAAKTPFRLLDYIGKAVGTGPLPAVNAFLERIAVDKPMGGWVVIASALGQQLDRDMAGAFARCRTCIVAADNWYAPDILGERVPGPALVSSFQPTLELLTPWRDDDNRWVRRAVGVTVHFWAKRVHGASEYAAQAETLLRFLEPMFEEQDVDAIKGVGWGLKTLGRHYPILVTDWLARQLVQHERHPRALMLRKALTYLSASQRARAVGKRS